MCWLGLHRWSKWQQFIRKWSTPTTPEGFESVRTEEWRRCYHCGKTDHRLVCDYELPEVSKILSGDGKDKAPLGLDD